MTRNIAQPHTGVRGPSAGIFSNYDVIDSRIDVYAQWALIRLRNNPATSADAFAMLAAVKRGRLRGIYGDNLRASAQLATRLGTVRWELVPRGQDAALILEPSAPPTIVFREGAREEPQRLDPALLRAWATYRMVLARRVAPCRNLVAPPQQGRAFVQPVSNVVPSGFCLVASRPPGRRRRRQSGPVLNITSPRPNQELIITPGDADVGPFMPAVFVSAALTSGGSPVAGATIDWSFRVGGTYRRRSPKTSDSCHPSPHFSACQFERYDYALGSAETPSGQGTVVDLDDLTDVIVGGTLTVNATATVGGRRVASEQVKCRIIGRNPERTEVERLIEMMADVGPCGRDGWLLRRIFCHESRHTMHQFNERDAFGGNVRGDVKYGPPSGIGISQRDPTPEEWRFPKANRVGRPNNLFPAIYWDWKMNVIDAINFFREVKLVLAVSDLVNLQEEAAGQGLALPTPCRGVVLRAAVRRYNGGREYGFEPAGAGLARYVVRPSVKKPKNPREHDPTRYVADVLGDHGHPRIPLPRRPKNARQIYARTSPTADDAGCVTCDFFTTA